MMIDEYIRPLIKSCIDNIDISYQIMLLSLESFLD